MAPPPTHKDMRRPDLIVPYQEPPPKSNEGPEFASTISSTLPMAAMFTRNKFVGWAAVVFAIQNWLGESEETRKTSSTHGFFNVCLSIMAMGVAYLPLFFPQAGGLGAGTRTGAPAPAGA